MSNIAPFRPPTGGWPPCPPPPGPCGPDFFSGLFWLQQNYEDVKRAKAFLRQLMSDIIAEDPTILSGGAPIPGVTDGADAQPGMVGEFVVLQQTVAYPATGISGQAVSMGVLPPGDWDCWAFAIPSTAVTNGQFFLSPPPAGFSNDMVALTYLGGATGDVTIASPLARCLTAAPVLIPFGVSVNNVTPGPAAGDLAITFNARRRR